LSTRATYQFTGSEYTPDVTFYIHYDGYAEGAASYFYDALMRPQDRDNRGGLAAAFLRANGLAEFTGGHDTHGDSEHQYTVKGEDAGAKLTVYSGYGKTWNVSFSGTLAAFLAKHPDMIDGFSPFKKVKTGYREMWLNTPLAQARLNERVATLTIWAKNAHGRNESPINEGNWRSMVKEAAQLFMAFPGLLVETDEAVVRAEIGIMLANPSSFLKEESHV
jgi:hypothetical protein